MAISIQRTFCMLAAVGAMGAAASLSAAADISGAGATFPYPIYAKWAEAYKAQTGVGLNYQAIGSGGGIKQIEAKTVDFGASDLPLKPEKLEEDKLIQWPQIVGGIVPIVNLKGVEPGKLRLTGAVLADIMMGKTTRWDDPAIAKLNAGLKLPSQAIAVVHRSDGSGTTYNFADYLAKTSQEWKDKVGVNASLDWPVGLGGKGNDGVAATVGQTDGAIGYVEYAYAKQKTLSYTLVQNKDGEYPQPSKDTFQAAAANADWKNAKGFYLLLTDQPGRQSWPITASSFILVYKSQDKPENGKQVLDFFDWAYKNGQKAAEDLDFVPMPESVVALVHSEWKAVVGGDGKPVWTASAK